MKIWIVMASSESGDNYGCIGAFVNKPSDEELQELIHYDNIGGDGCGQDDEGPIVLLNEDNENK